jgi:uncharacterized protein
METSLHFTLTDDATQAAVKELVPGCTEEMVRTALEHEDITTGIRWGAIARAVSEVNRTGTVLRDVIVASVDDMSYSVHYGRNGDYISGEAIAEMRRNLAAIGTALRDEDTSTRLHNGVFVKANETAFTVTAAAKAVNIYGNELPVPPKPTPFPKERCLAIKSTPEGYQLIALASGYLIVNEQGAFDIADPFASSDDNLILYCYVIPMIHGRDMFLDKIIKSVPSSPASNANFSAVHDWDIPDTDHLVKLELRRGKRPIPGRPGSIRFLITPDTVPRSTLGQNIDYRETHRFKEVTEGTILAERIPMRQSVPGLNVFGDPINIPQVKDIIFSYGNGVTEEFSPDLIRYKAKELGILEMSDNFLDVVSDLVINGDVGNNTGNIKYSKSVLVKGTIASGFKVESGDLTVRENIEDCVEVICNGNLHVSKGILGERTKITVSGNAKIGIIQGATLRAGGDCTIEEYAYHSKIFCAKKLMIHGKGILSKEKGCTIGGTISCLQTMELHSVGSSATLTTLCCGFDPEGFSALMETIDLQKTLKKKIILLQNSLHFDATQKEAMLLKVQYYSADKKEKLKNNLIELRQTIGQVEKLGATVALLSRKVFTSDIEKSIIFIHNHCIAPVLVEFPKHKRKIFHDASGVQFRSVDDEITMYDGMHHIDDTPSNPR